MRRGSRGRLLILLLLLTLGVVDLPPLSAAEGGKPKQDLNALGSDYSLTEHASPNGRIALVRQHPKSPGRKQQLVVVETSSGKESVVLAGRGLGTPAAVPFTDDLLLPAYSEENLSSDIFRVGMSSPAVLILGTGAEETNVVVSPSGKAFVFARELKDGRRSIFLFDIPSSRELPLVDSPRDEVPTAWSPDGKMVLFDRSNFRSEDREIWAVNTRTGRTERVVKPPRPNEEVHSAKFDPAGGYLFIYETRRRRHLYRSSLGGPWEVVASRAGDGISQFDVEPATGDLAYEACSPCHIRVLEAGSKRDLPLGRPSFSREEYSPAWTSSSSRSSQLPFTGSNTYHVWLGLALCVIGTKLLYGSREPTRLRSRQK